jgi:hypothetical protein
MRFLWISTAIYGGAACAGAAGLAALGAWPMAALCAVFAVGFPAIWWTMWFTR